MKTTSSFTAWLLSIVLLVSNFGAVFANPPVVSTDVIDTLYATKETFSKSINGADWIHSIVVT